MSAPLVSFGLPVYNGSDEIKKTLDTILAQTVSDLEIVVSDNASTDDTPEVARAYSARDPRVVYFRNAENRGIRENFNNAFHRSRGKYFRWISVGDWVEPTYSERCVAALEAVPDAIAATTNIVFWDEVGERHYAEYHGPRVTAATPSERFTRALLLMLEDYKYFDPMYALHRRELLGKSQLERLMTYADFALTSECALIGPFTHVPEILAHRSRPVHAGQNWISRMAPPGHPPLPYPPLHLLKEHVEMLSERNLSPAEWAQCMGTSLYFCSRLAGRRSLVPRWRQFTKALRRVGVPVDEIKRALG